MVDHEVENALRELRERVRAEAGALSTATVASAPRMSGDEEQVFNATLARIEAQLAVIARAHQRLPPLMSNRRGLSARVELRVKKLIKRATHWFTWEQVNFNTAVHLALRDALAALAVQRRELSELRDAHEQSLAELKRELGDARESHSRLRESHERAHAETLGEIAAIRSASQQANLSFDSVLDETKSALRNEMSESIERLLEEQRVCYRQLSLEASETAVMHDRARRGIEARLATLEKRCGA